MKCPVCNNTQHSLVYSYDAPDKYEMYMNLGRVYRMWLRCKCGTYLSWRDYDLAEFQKIYESGYRDKEFRGETIGETYDRVANLEESENDYRVMWFCYNVPLSASVLDVGSGFGIFPKALSMRGYEVVCLEPNYESYKFIEQELHLPCVNDSMLDFGQKYDVVSAVHVLEHMASPVTFLQTLKKVAKTLVFLEIPDAEEFDHLPMDHNEFSSDHVYMYDSAALCRLIDKAGLNLVTLHRVKYEERNLSRIMAVCGL